MILEITKLDLIYSEMEVGFMPKTSARKKSSGARKAERLTTAPDRRVASMNGTGESRREAAQARPLAGSTGMVGLIMPAMVALGCWGMAFTFTVFSTESNHLLFGSMAGLMALMWSISFAIRARKVLQQK